MKYGNVKLDEISAVVDEMGLSQDESEKCKYRLLLNLKSFLPCDVPQETIVLFSKSDSYNIADFLFSTKSNPDEMEFALAYNKHSHNIDYIVKRIEKIFRGPHSVNKEKELYYLEALCTKEMMGMSFDFYYKWYSAAISFTDYVCCEISTKEILDSYQSVFSAGIEFAGPHLEELFTQMMWLLFSDFDESRNPDKVLDFYGLSKKYGFAMNIYEDMVDTGFSTPELNPETFILELWDSYHSPQNIHPRAVFDISCKTGLPAREIMDFLMTHGKIDSQLIFDSWDSGSDPESIALEFELETKDVQAYLKENLHLLKRKEDLWQLDYDYDDCDDW